ncbi:MAG TPA: DUF6428 family protein [Candidatus Babeliaceae bacterium]|nr:DUF6428 family protein [Candidatus Babeliaceae bacterium]
MKLSELKHHLAYTDGVNFQLHTGAFVPPHFHITEVGIISKDFIDCGGTVRHEKVASLQLWNASDYDHRLKADKLLNIITLSEKVLGMEDLEIEVEYQTETIGKYSLGFDGENFMLLSKQTACLATDTCGVPQAKQKLPLAELSSSKQGCCTPGGGCC